MRPRIIQGGQKLAKRPTKQESLKAALELRAAVVHLRRELHGAILVTGILVDRAGGEVEITQQEMVNADGWKLVSGFNPKGEYDSDATWMFKVVKPELTPEEIEQRRVDAMTPDEIAAYQKQCAEEWAAAHAVDQEEAAAATEKMEGFLAEPLDNEYDSGRELL